MPFLCHSYTLAAPEFRAVLIHIDTIHGNMKNYLAFQNIICTFAPKKSVLWKLSKVRKSIELSSFLNRYLSKC